MTGAHPGMAYPRLLHMGLLLATACFAVLGMCVGSTGLDNLAAALLSPGHDASAYALAQQIVLDIRLPRTLGAWAAGALLGLAGAMAQGLFRNPLADPFLLGSASGASLGVALALAAMSSMSGSAYMLVSLSGGASAGGWLLRLGLTGSAFLGAVLAVLLTIVLSRGVQHTMRLLLAGVVVGVVLGALTQLVLLMWPDSLQTMQAFLLGSTSFVGWASFGLMAVVWLVCAALAVMLAKVLDGLSLGESTAVSLGLPLRSMRAALVAVLALATAAAVAQTGLIAFVGLAAPHLVRSMARVKHAQLMLLSSLVGGLLLMAADTAARWLVAPQELPVGVLTAVLGGGYLLWLMRGNSAPTQA
jgi:iron complex transport system permease protein